MSLGHWNIGLHFLIRQSVDTCAGTNISLWVGTQVGEQERAREPKFGTASSTKKEPLVGGGGLVKHVSRRVCALGRAAGGCVSFWSWFFWWQREEGLGGQGTGTTPLYACVCVVLCVGASIACWFGAHVGDEWGYMVGDDDGFL